MQKLLLKNIDPKNQIILFLFFRPTNPILFAVLPVDQKINLVSPYKYTYTYIIQVNIYVHTYT